MKLILTGATGFVGTEILTQCLAHPSITSIIALSRKPLPSALTSNPKLKVVIIEDFTSYPSSVISQLAGADACIWTIGAKSTSEQVTRKVSIGYTMSAAQAFARIPKSSSKKFRFVFTSGVLAIRDPEQSVWLYPAARKAAGEAETKLIEFAKEKEEIFEAFIMRPATVLAKDGGLKSLVMGVGPSLRVDELAASLIDTAINGGRQQTLENAELRVKGRELLAGQK